MSKRLVALTCLFVSVLAGCKVDTDVSIRVNRDGSGAVTVTAALDPDAVQAAEAAGGKLEDRVRVGDLTKAGWAVQPWVRAADGSARLVLRKPFDSPDQVAGIMREVSGSGGPLRDVTVTRDRGLLSTHYDVKGSLDLAQLQTGVAADPDLAASLASQHVDLAALDQSLLAQMRDSFHVDVTLHLPGGDRRVVGTAGKTASLDASTSVLDTRRVGLVVLAIVLAILAVGVLLWPRRRARRRRSPSAIGGRRTSRATSPGTD